MITRYTLDVVELGSRVVRAMEAENEDTEGEAYEVIARRAAQARVLARVTKNSAA
jgi:hypothetical protein